MFARQDAAFQIDTAAFYEETGPICNLIAETRLALEHGTREAEHGPQQCLSCPDQDHSENEHWRILLPRPRSESSSLLSKP